MKNNLLIIVLFIPCYWFAVLGYNGEKLNFKLEVWLTAYPVPYQEKVMTIYR